MNIINNILNWAMWLCESVMQLFSYCVVHIFSGVQIASGTLVSTSSNSSPLVSAKDLNLLIPQRLKLSAKLLLDLRTCHVNTLVLWIRLSRTMSLIRPMQFLQVEEVAFTISTTLSLSQNNIILLFANFLIQFRIPAFNANNSRYSMDGFALCKNVLFHWACI